MKKITNYLTETIKKQKILLVFIITTFLVGLIFGSLFINFISSDDKSLLTNQVTTYFGEIKKLSSEVFGLDVFASNSINNIIQIIIIFVLGISMIGIIAVIVIMFFKGFTLGVTLSTIILKYQLKGVVGCFLYIFPCMIINILIYLFICFFAVYASIKFLKALLKKDNLNFKKFLGKYMLSFMISIVLMVIYSFIDAYLTPLMLKIFTFII